MTFLSGLSIVAGIMIPFLFITIVLPFSLGFAIITIPLYKFLLLIINSIITVFTGHDHRDLILNNWTYL